MGRSEPVWTQPFGLGSRSRPMQATGRSVLSVSREERRVVAHFHSRMLFVAGKHGYVIRNVSCEAVRGYQTVLTDISRRGRLMPPAALW
jgi:hypothetical protein